MVRVLERETSITLAQEQGFPKENLVFYHAGESEALLLETLHPQAILTKESGESGGFSEKVKAAQAAKIPVFAIKRPSLPRHFMIVTGEYGLRKQIEKNIPAFYPLRSGYTTGLRYCSCKSSIDGSDFRGRTENDILPPSR